MYLSVYIELEKNVAKDLKWITDFCIVYCIEMRVGQIIYLDEILSLSQGLF